MRAAETTAPRTLAGHAAQDTETTPRRLRLGTTRRKAMRLVLVTGLVRCAACGHMIVGEGAHCVGMLMHVACASTTSGPRGM